jgi:hypothetical protein
VAARQRINAEGQKLDHEVFGAIKRAATDAWNWVKTKAGAAITAIVNHFGNVKTAINTIKSLANDFWGILKKIGAFLARPFSLHINFPSPPGWLTALVGGITGGGGGGTTGKTPGRGGWTPGNPTGQIVVAGGGPQIHVHYHAPVIGEAAVNATIQKAIRANARAGNASLIGGLVQR